MFSPGQRIAIGASGGKDSTVLAHTLKLLNERHGYGLELLLLSIDEGIKGYRDDSLETVKKNQQEYALPLTILSYEQIYGWTMDAIVSKIGKRNNCTFCGVFRRQALDRGAKLLNCHMIVTGHNADDIAETLLLNLFRGDHGRLAGSTDAITRDFQGSLAALGQGVETGCSTDPLPELVPRCKPFKWTYEKEIVMYAYFKRLTYFSTECPYAPDSYRGHVREFIKELEAIKPSIIHDVIWSGDQLGAMLRQREAGSNEPPARQASRCTRCGYLTSNPDSLCKACLLIEGLNTDNPMLGVTGRRRA